MRTMSVVYSKCRERDELASPWPSREGLLIGILLIFSCLLIFQGTAGAAGTVRVTGHTDRAPFDWQEGKEIHGAAVEILERIFAELDTEVESKYVGPWARALLNLAEGTIDALCGVYITDERRKFAEFSLPFREDRVSIFVWHERPFAFATWDDLRGKTFGDVIGASRGQDFDTWRKENARVDYVKDNVSNMKKLEKGRIDCFVMSHESGLIFIKKYGYAGRIVALPKPVRVHELRYAFSKKSPFVKYLPQVNKRLLEMRADGTIDRIIKENADRYLSRGETGMAD